MAVGGPRVHTHRRARRKTTRPWVQVGLPLTLCLLRRGTLRSNSTTNISNTNGRRTRWRPCAPACPQVNHSARTPCTPLAPLPSALLDPFFGFFYFFRFLSVLCCLVFFRRRGPCKNAHKGRRRCRNKKKVAFKQRRETKTVCARWTFCRRDRHGQSYGHERHRDRRRSSMQSARDTGPSFSFSPADMRKGRQHGKKKFAHGRALFRPLRLVTRATFSSYVGLCRQNHAVDQCMRTLYYTSPFFSFTPTRQDAKVKQPKEKKKRPPSSLTACFKSLSTTRMSFTGFGGGGVQLCRRWRYEKRVDACFLVSVVQPFVHFD